MNTNQRTTACGSCPFSLNCKPGALGGSPIEVYIGQILGPFFLPCHAQKDYKGNDQAGGCQCAGAAVTRANLKVDAYLPDALLHLPMLSDPNVFTGLREFIEHHRPEMDKDDVDYLIRMAPRFLRNEFEKAVAKGRIQPV